MKRFLFTSLLSTFAVCAYGQTKTIVGIMPFSGGKTNSYTNAKNTYVIAIQDAVSDAFLSTKRFTLVEREKMDLIQSEKKQQQSEDFIDGNVVEQSRSMGASYIVTGNVLEAEMVEKESSASGLTGMATLGVLGNIKDRKASVNFSLKVISVETGEIVASEKFSAQSKGKTGFDKALESINPEIQKFIKDNFKVSLNVLSVEAKNANNEATKLLITGGSAMGLTTGTSFKIYEEAFYSIDGKRVARKKEVGKMVIERVEDESFSIGNVTMGGKDIATKMEAGTKLKCELITD